MSLRSLWRDLRSDQKVLAILFTLLIFLFLGGAVAALGYIYINKQPSNCPSEWSPHDGACFKAFSAPSEYNITEAKGRCEKHAEGAALASIHNQDENHAVSTLLEHGDGWLNAILNTQSWIWGDGTAWDFENWAQGQPANEKCIKMSLSGHWITTHCDGTAKEYICKLNPVANEETMTTQISNVATTTASTIEITNSTENLIMAMLTPEAIVGFSFQFVPGLCLSGLGILMTIIGLFTQAPKSKDVSTGRKLLSSTILAVVPFFIIDILSTLANFCNKHSVNPTQLIWFFDDANRTEKLLYINITKMFYGQVLSLFFNVYVMMKTPVRSVQITQWISIVFGILGLVKLTTSLLIFKLEVEEEPNQKSVSEKVKHFLKTTFFFVLTVLRYLPLFLMNSAFNILTMVLFLSFCERIGNWWIAFIYFIPLILFNFIVISTKEIPFLTRLHMSWTNLFVLTVPPTIHSKMVITLAVTLQMGHFFINIAALCVFVFFRPNDYIIVLGVLGLGILSLVPMAWQLMQTWRDQDNFVKID